MGGCELPQANTTNTISGGLKTIQNVVVESVCANSCHVMFEICTLRSTSCGYHIDFMIPNTAVCYMCVVCALYMAMNGLVIDMWCFRNVNNNNNI